MKVLYISAFFWPQIGGIETLSLKFLPSMQDRGYEFYVVTSLVTNDSRPIEKYKGIPIHRFPFLKAIADKNIRLMHDGIQVMADIKNTFKPDLIHLQMSAPIAFYHISTLQVEPSPTLLSLHTCFGKFSAGKDTLLGRTLRAADWTTMVSKAVQDDVIKVYPEISARSSIVYNGIEYPNHSLMPLHIQRQYIIGIGRLINKKGFDILIDAFSLILEKFPHARLIIVGDGTERAFLEDQVKHLKIENAVRFLGKVHPQEIPELINKANIVVVPSRSPDPLPTVALEAGFLGRPVVASAMGGLKEIILDGETEFLIEGDDPHSFANAIQHLLSFPQNALRFGEAARLRMREVFGWDRYIDAYDQLYRQITEKGHSG